MRRITGDGYGPTTRRVTFLNPYPSNGLPLTRTIEVDDIVIPDGGATIVSHIVDYMQPPEVEAMNKHLREKFGRNLCEEP